MTAGDRARAVVARLETAAAAAGLPSAVCARLSAVLTAALERRADHFRDPHHPDFLHAARTPLILLHDTPLADADALAAAILFDSEEPALTFGAAEAEALAGPAAAAFVASLPSPAAAGEELLERLVGSTVEARLVALAERLDHARHLHQQPTERWFPFHRDVQAIYLPVAERTDATLARRFRWWADMFAQRYL